MVSSALMHLGLGTDELVMFIDEDYPKLYVNISLLQIVNAMIESAIDSITRIKSRLKRSSKMYLPSAIPDCT